MLLGVLSLLTAFERTAPKLKREQRLRAAIDENFAFVWRTLRRFGVPAADVDDAVQQVLLVFNQKLDSVEVGKERRFLYATAMNTASNVRRGLRRRREHPDGETVIEAHVEDDAVTPEALASRRQLRTLLDRTLESMTEDRRVVFTLFELEQMTCPEIADLLDVPVGTVASRLHRARNDFRVILSELHAETRDGGKR